MIKRVELILCATLGILLMPSQIPAAQLTLVQPMRQLLRTLLVDDPSAPSQPLQGMLNADVVVLPKDGSVTLSDITPTTVTLTGQVPALKPGLVVVGGPSPGIMRRILTVTESDNAFHLETANANLSDVYQQAHAQFNGPVQFEQPTYLAPGVTVQVK